MIGKNIRRYRMNKGLSQEELSRKLNVVRQTVSKWENGLSVPDAITLKDMAVVLDVSVNDLLGIETDAGISADNDILGRQLEEERLKAANAKKIGDKRSLIIFLSFLSLIIAISVRNPIISILLSGGCMLFAVIVLYRNLALLSSLSTDDMRMRALRATSVFTITMLAVCIIASSLISGGIIELSAKGEQLAAMAVIAVIMVFTGLISPKLPFTRHTGLRLPWTVRDEDTWHLAHRILGYISIPLTVLYVACALTIPDFKTVTLAAMLLWIGIPGVISLVFYLKKIYGRL